MAQLENSWGCIETNEKFSEIGSQILNKKYFEKVKNVFVKHLDLSFSTLIAASAGYSGIYLEEQKYLLVCLFTN